MDKIKVFVSSAMRSESNCDLDWIAVRRDVANSIEKHAMFEVFAIEEHASPEPSNQYMLSKVSECDIYVLILGSELRWGTEQEYKKAHELQKGMLVYTLNTSRDSKCAALLKELERDDYCTYRKIDSVEGLGHRVAGDLIEHLVRRYKDLSGTIQEDDASSQLSFDGSHLIDTAPRYFGDASLALGNRLGYTYGAPIEFGDRTILRDLGCAMVDWIVEGTTFSMGESSGVLLEVLRDEGISIGSDDAFILRWKALDLFLLGDVAGAISHLERAVLLLDDESHVLTSVLIDLRNLNSMEQRLNEVFNYQNEIDSRGIKLYAPAGGIYSSGAAETMLNALDSAWTVPERTRVFGEYRLASVLLNLSKQLFTSFVYGSISGVLCCRREISKAIMRFSRLYNDKSLYVRGLKVCILSGESKLLKDWMIAGIEYANQEIVARAEELWKASIDSSSGGLNTCGCIIFSRLGEYFGDDCFSSASRLVLARAGELSSISKPDYYAAISSNARRMNPGMIIHALCSLLENQSLTSVAWLHATLRELRIEDASNEDHAMLASAIRKAYPLLAKNGFSASSVALLSSKSDAFASLGAEIKSQLSGVELVEFELNERDGEVPAEYVIAQIEEAKSQLEINGDPGQYVEFGTRPARYLVRLITPNRFKGMAKRIEPHLLDLFAKIPQSHAYASFLDDYIALAIHIVLLYGKAGIFVPSELIMLGESLTDMEPAIQPLISSYERRAWDARIATYGYVSGIQDEEEFLKAISDMWDLEVGSREAYTECIEAYLDANYDKQSGGIATVAIAMHFFCRDRDEGVRLSATRSAMRLVGTSADREARRMLHALCSDPSASVRFGLLSLGSELLGGYDILLDIVEYLSHDAHYRIRKKALKMLPLLTE